MGYFQRLNFFKGLFTRAEDWQKEQRYHMDKHRLLLKCLFTPGIVPGELDGLKVELTPDGGITVLPGYAIDAQGRDLYLAEPRKARPIEGDSERELFVYIEFAEKLTDKRRNELNPETGDAMAFFQEEPTVDWTAEKPDNRKRIELARVKWKPERRLGTEHIDHDHRGTARLRHSGKFATRVAGPATFPVEPSQNVLQSQTDPRIRIDDKSPSNGAIYVATAYPDPAAGPTQAKIYWRIESELIDNSAQYYLVLKNFGTQRVRVCYEVFRLDLDANAPT